MPSTKCGVCSKYMPATDGAKCAKCLSVFHKQCVSLPQAGSVPTSWRCSPCLTKASKEKRLESPRVDTENLTFSSPSTVMVEKEHSMVGSINCELRRIRDELRTVRSEFQAFREEVEGLRNLSDRVDELDKRVTVLEERTNLQPSDNTSLLNETVANLKRELNDRDQDLLSNDLEITNLPESSGENLGHTIKLLGTKLGVTLVDTDIVSLDRIGSRYINATDSSGPTERRPRTVVLRLARRDLRDQVLKAARTHRGANTGDFNLPGHSRRFYINERLTKQNRLLFRQAREAAKSSGWRYVWTSRGRILARQQEGKSVITIRCEADIHQVFDTKA